MNISIIIPHYNSFESLRRLVKSIPDIETIEVLIVDDGSSKKYPFEELTNQRKNVKFFFNEFDKGAGGARNTGLDRAQGKYLLFADSDDVFCDNAFEILNHYLYSDLEVVYFSPDGTHISGEPTTRHYGYQRLVKNFLDLGDESIRYKFHVPWSKLILRELVVRNNIRFDEVIVSNDVMFSLKVGVYAKKIAAEKNSIYTVFESHSSLIKSASIERLEVRRKVIIKYNDFLTKHGIGSQYYISQIQSLYKIAKVSPIVAVKAFLNSISQGEVVFAFKGVVSAFARTFSKR